MTQVKICGISKPEELIGIQKGMPDYIGFVFAPSKRKVSLEQAISLSKAVNAKINRVGVFVDMKTDELLKQAAGVPLDIIQLHGDESPEYCRCIKQEGYKVWKSFTIRTQFDLEKIKDYQVDGYLVDAAGPLKGGNGITFPWEWAQHISVEGKLILAGGLKIENVEEAIKMVKPDVLDVSSGVEVQGRKNENKVLELINQIRRKQK
ncbi:phosphoribosylanthranilate isomerase [Tindallia californiensis]|uniref:N-(5'-phosphoribosyl)anthranilate isomerase n=1 Tax=Tindallia californiensis TaxID=159292 RepID=A0A1H3IJ95_9FIRM|nr:phosphoribosylanthranilate isomerase [Tindallia californiensis]SDY27780.1 phosphoribosylanthranilate isomerase [Tindallia californiensis]